MKKQITLLIVFLFCTGFYSCQKEPQASFTVSKTNAYTGEVITFTNTTVDADTYEWDFGDGSQSTTSSPTHIYHTPGTFIISLKAYSKNQKKSDIMTASIVITSSSTASPVADFTYTPASIECVDTVSFSDQSTENPTSWLWDFGDGSTSTLQNPTHIYTASGTYSVTLVATNSLGSDTTSAILTVINSAVNLIGVYNVMDTVTGIGAGLYNYYVTVTSNDCCQISIQNFGGYGNSAVVNCIINGTSITIPSQHLTGIGLPCVINGSGTTNSSVIMNINYTAVYDAGGTDYGNAAYTKL